MASDEPIERKIRADYARGAELFDGRAMGLVLSWLDAARKRAEEAEGDAAWRAHERDSEAKRVSMHMKRAAAAEKRAEKLEAALVRIRDVVIENGTYDPQDIARRALTPTTGGE